ncbi:ferrous iron transport protein B [Christensenella intestinihominis]|uniref:ferrous iron transport protein B n=1 Tax=Christensenella intestinihominis TaxID=1851429 RepID=UPI0008327DBC|nr:ferrous iron transport protein B [Christensenella intestinihominis]
MKFALAGNPNCGKTTMFNNLTGASQYVGNWPGVTVEKKEGKLKDHRDIIVTDLPGIYSLSPYTLEEVVARNYLLAEHPDVIIDIVDATNIERNLYLTTQLLETGIPVVIALNMMDVIKKRGDKIDIKKLSEKLGCPIVETSALKGSGLSKLIETATASAKTAALQPIVHKFAADVESSLTDIEGILSGVVDQKSLRWYAIKLFERDEKVEAQFKFKADTRDKINEIIKLCENQYDDDSESIITNERYLFIHGLMRECVKKREEQMTISDRIDRVVTNRVAAIPIFIGVMFLVYFISVSWLGTIVTDWTNDVLFGEYISGWASDGLAAIGAADWAQSLVVDGIIGGVGAIIGFVPQMLILFVLLALLEDCGYMARVAFIMDRIFRKFGLSGKSFIPMLVASGCGVPGIMASRTIENESDRRMTIMTTTFVPCGAKLPIIALIAGAMFPENSWWLAPCAYFLGIGMVIISGIILKKTKPFAGEPAPFVMELPQYRVPGAKGVLIHMWERGKSFIIKAGTIIFASTVVIWLLSNFNTSFEMVDINESMLAGIGNAIAPVFAPLGFGDWQSSVATITGLVAKENVVATMGVLHGIAEATEESAALLASVAGTFTVVSAFSFMAFNLLCAPCFAAIGAIKREMNSAKWTWAAIGYQTLLAYVVAFIIFQLGSVFVLGQPFGVGAVIAIALIALIVWLMARKGYDPSKRKASLSAVEANS